MKHTTSFERVVMLGSLVTTLMRGFMVMWPVRMVACDLPRCTLRHPLCVAKDACIMFVKTVCLDLAVLLRCLRVLHCFCLPGACSPEEKT
jgi:hypothetical protein